MIKKKILIMGITGQDGSYLAKLFLNKKFIVHGTSRQKGDWAKNIKYLNISNKIRIYQTDKKFNNLNKILSNIMNKFFFLVASQATTNLKVNLKMRNMTVK